MWEIFAEIPTILSSATKQSLNKDGEQNDNNSIQWIDKRKEDDNVVFNIWTTC